MVLISASKRTELQGGKREGILGSQTDQESDIERLGVNVGLA